jgi:ketosteroid isomerase-like protein
VRSPGGAAPVVRTGPTLTVFRKEGGRWLLARDANMLTTVT